MKIPETYEEFLNLTENDLIKIYQSKMSLLEAQRMMHFFDKFDSNYIKKSLNESSNIIKVFGDHLK